LDNCFPPISGGLGVWTLEDPGCISPPGSGTPQTATTVISTDLTSEQSIFHILLEGSFEIFLLLRCTHAAIKKKIHQCPHAIPTLLDVAEAIGHTEMAILC